VKGATVPHSASPAVARSAPELPGTAGAPSVSSATGRTATAAARNWTPVTATGSRPRSSRACETVNVADTSCDASTSPSPASVAPPPLPPATRTTPASDTANPAQASGRATLCCHTAAMIAISTGAAPISNAAWVTLVRMIPRFCSTTDPPYPAAPLASTAGLQTARIRDRAATSSTAAARPNRAKVSQAGGSQSSASLDSGTVVPQSSPAAVSAGKTRRRLFVMTPASPTKVLNLSARPICEIIFSEMPVHLDDVDLQLLTELQVDADRTNVELARVVGLSPAATLNRVRRLKESGVIRVISARVDPAAAGFPLQMYVAATLGRHDPRATRVFEDQVRALPQIIAADNVTGEMDYLLTVVARSVSELQQVLAALATRGGQRLVTYLRLEELKPPSTLPLVPSEPAPRRRVRRAATQVDPE
jgi:Lrp/AsnC family transcriptional regulator, leucine-responsive regulatory protein